MRKKESVKRSVTTQTIFVIFGLFLSLVASRAASAQSVASDASSIQPISSEVILFNTDLKLGSQGDDVQRLQQYLNTNGFPLVDSGFGSLGQETTYFGQLTKNALMRFQKNFEQEILAPLNLTSPTGNFYISTRTFVNNDLLKKVIIPPLVADEETILNKNIKKSGASSARYHVVTPSGDDTMSITPNGDQSVAAGGTISFTVTPDTGYEIATSVGGTCSQGSWVGSVYTTGKITHSCTVIFTSEVSTYTVTLSGDGVAPVGARTVSHGGTQSFTVEDGVGYGLGTVGGTCPEGSWVHATYTTGSITASCSVSFEPASIGGSIGSTIATSSGSLFLRQNGNNFEYSITGSDWDSFALLPTITNTGGDTLTVYLLGDFTVSNVNSYLAVDSNNITIQGETGKEGPTIITIDGVTNYPGFIRNGSAIADGFDNITISNVFVNAVDSTLAQNGGWLAQEYFGVGATNNEINSCGSNGNISENSGGIVGARSSHVTISDCFSTGTIAISAGGIVGALADTVTVQNSYSSGLINVAAGGIFGGSAFNSVAQNTYSTGLINGDAGGIFGEAHDNPTVLNSYTSGFVVSNGKGILAGSSSDGVGNYSESNNSGFGWSDTNASSVLTGINTIWKSIGFNQPYKLLSFNASPYDDSTQTLTAGESSSAVFGYYNSCSIVSISGGDPDSHDEITIDSDTGVVSTTNTVEGGTYDILVFCDSIHGTYTLSTLELTVN